MPHSSAVVFRKHYFICNPPPPVPARKTQCSGATFRRAVFSAKEVPGAQDLSPRAQTHLPFGCSVVGVMWKPKASLNLQKVFFHLSVCRWFLVSSMSEPATGPVDMQWSTDLQAWVQSPPMGHRSFFCTFCHLALPPTEVFCTFCHLALIGIQSCPFFSPCRNKSERKVATGRQMHTSVELHQTALHISDKCPFRKALIDITIDHCIQITHLSVLGHKSSIRSQQAFHSTKRCLCNTTGDGKG